VCDLNLITTQPIKDENEENLLTIFKNKLNLTDGQDPENGDKSTKMRRGAMEAAGGEFAGLRLRGVSRVASRCCYIEP